jgi:molybdopterin converting factor small subunit
MKIRLIVTGRAYHQAASLPTELQLCEGSTLQDALAQINALTGNDSPLSTSCLIALGGRHCGTMGRYENRALTDGDELTLIAPVAGG